MAIPLISPRTNRYSAFRPAKTARTDDFAIPPINHLSKLNVRPLYYRTNWTAGDGNCQFRAFAKAFGFIDHIAARKAAIDCMFTKYRYFSAFYADDNMEKQYGDFDDYLLAMANLNEYGDQLTLAALAGAFGVTIQVLRLANGNDYQWREGGKPFDGGDTGRTIKLFYNARTKHYENLIAASEM